MKIKLKKDADKLPSYGSHQGFPVEVWNQLNNGKTVEFDKIPEKAKDKVEEVSAAASIKKTIKASSSKGGK